LNRYCISEYRRETRLKRGGGQAVAELDGSEQSPAENPEEHFERQWAISLVDDAFLKVEREYQEAEKKELFKVISPFLTGREKNDPGYADLAETLGMSAGAVQVAVYRLRKRYRRAFEDAVAATIEDEGQLEDEMRHVLKILTV